ncbi:MAG: hypothetical protein ACRCVG_07600 [Methanobacteriaceae archaeon]
MKILKTLTILLAIFLVIFVSASFIGNSYASEDNLNCSIHYSNFNSSSLNDSNISNNSENNSNSSISTIDIHFSNNSNNNNTSSDNYYNHSNFNISNSTLSPNSSPISSFSNGITVFAIGDEIYVSVSGNDSNNGYTPETAKRTIAAALTAVNNGGTIYILEGTYSGTGNVGLTINKNVTIVGVTALNDVIINGNTSQRIITVGNNVNLQIKNIIFTNAQITGSGAVIYSLGTNILNISLNNCTFINNYATLEGGAIYLYGVNVASKINLTVINCTFNNNTANAAYGGAISMYYGSLLYIENSSFKNNTATYSGAIETNQINTTIIGSNFTGNKATLAFGGVMNHDIGSNTINVRNCIFTNNSCYIDGGAFRVSDLAKLNINDSVFTSNFAGNEASAEGGAIYSETGVVTVTNSNFTNNSAYLRGGAIGSYSVLSSSGLFVYGCNFVNNYVTQSIVPESSNTILIWGNHPVEINYNRFYNNTGSPNGYVVYSYTALTNASLSYNWWGDNKLPVANTFALNKITNYFVVDVIFDNASSSIANFNYTIKLNNSGSFNASKLPIFYGNAITSPNFYNGNFSANVSDLISIPLNGNSGNITFTFKVDNWNKSISEFIKSNTSLIFDSIPNTPYGGNINITGTLVDGNGDPISGASVNLTINGFTYTIVTASNGSFSLAYTVNDTGTIYVIGEFYGTDDFLASSNITSFNVIPTNTSIIIDPIPDTQIGKTVIINGTLLDSNSNPLANLTVNILVNGFLYSVTTDLNGKFNVTYIVNTSGIIAVFAQFSGNERFNASSNTSSFNGLHINTKITINNISNTHIGNITSITGNLFDEYNQPIANANITITINGFNYLVQTNSTGGFTLNYLVNSTGTITVFVYFGGNGTYSSSSNSTTFLASRINTTIIVDNINNTKIGNNINITGTLVDEYGQVIANENVTIIVNGFSYNVTTNINGSFILYYLVNTTGNIPVLFHFNGNNRYNPSTNITYFNSSKINTVIVVDSIVDTKIGTNVSISGILIDENGNPIANKTITLTINSTSTNISTNISTNVTTDATGKFNYNYTVINSGSINIRFDFNGDDTFNPSTNVTSFNGLKLDTVIVVNGIVDTKIGNSTNISGTLVDENGNPIANKTVTLTINSTSTNISTNISTNVTTDATGKFNYNYTVINSGSINIRFDFNGDNTFNPSTNTTSFNGLKLDTNIIINNIIDTKVGNSTNISGILVDENGNYVGGRVVSLVINGVVVNVTTNGTGGFTYVYTVVSSGSIGVRFDFEGDDTFNPSTNTTSFNGLKIDTNIIINNIIDTKIGTNASINGTLVDENGNPISNKTVTLTINSTSTNISTNVTTDATGKFNYNYTVINSGSINIRFDFNGDNTFNPSTNTTSFNGLKLDTNIIVNNIIDTKIGTNASISGILVDENGNPIINANITIIIANSSYTVTTGIDGNFSLKYPVSFSGSILVIYHYLGNDTYSSSSNITSFNGLKISTMIIADNISTTSVGNNVNITGTLVDENNINISNETIIIILNGVSYNVITNSSGGFILNYAVTSTGAIGVNYIYEGNEIYEASTNFTSFNGIRINTNIVVDAINSTRIGDNVTISGILLDENSNPVSGANVTIVVDGVSWIVVTDSSGIFTLNYTVDRSGIITVIYKYDGNETYNPSSNSTSFEGLKLNTTININNINNTKISNNVNISGILLDENNNPISNGTITIIINGIATNVTTNNTGGFNYEYTVNTTGHILVTYEYSGNNTFNPSFNSTSFEGLKLNTTININNITNTRIGDNVTINGTLVDENNNPITGANVTIVIDGISGIVITDSSGIFTLNYTVIRSGIITVIYKYDGNDTFNPSSNSSSFEGLKLNTTININNITNTRIGDNVTINGTLVDENSNPVSGANVTIVIDGISWVVVTDSSGIFTLNYTVDRSGIITVIYKYDGNETYNPSSNSTNFEGLKLNTTINITNITNTKIGNNVTISGVLVDENNNPIPNGIITIIINGIATNVTTNNTGGFNYEYIVNTTGYIFVTYEYNGNETFNPSSNSTSFEGLKLNTTIIIDSINSTRIGDNVNISGVLVDENNNPIVGANVTIVVDGVSWVVVTDSSGSFVLNYLVSQSGVLSVIYQYAGNDTFNSSCNNSSFKGLKLNSQITFEDINYTKIGNIVNITGFLIDENHDAIVNANVTVSINGTSYTVKTDANGKFNLSYTVISAETITILFEYNGNETYNPSTNCTSLTGLKLDTNIIIDNINDSRIGNNVNITGILLDENGNFIPNVNITININGIVTVATTNSTGGFKYEYIVTNSDIINVRIDYGGNDIYNPTTNITSFNGLKLNTTIEIDTINNSKYNNTTVISGRLIDEDGNPIANALIELYIMGNHINSTFTDINGRFSFNYLVSMVGDINAVIIYNGNNTFESSANESSFTGLRLDTAIIFDPINNTKINNSAIISGKIVDEYNRPVNNVQINVFVNGFLYTGFTDENGRFSFSHPVSSPITINVIGTFLGTDIFAPSTNSTYFMGLPLDTTIIFDSISNATINDTIIINGTIIDENNNPMANVNITVTINGTDYVLLTDNMGKFSISYFVSTETGIFNVYGVFEGNMYYAYSYNSTSFIVNKIPTNLNVSNVSGTVGDKVNLTATLTTSNGSFLVNKEIIFYIKINGSYVLIGTNITDANGVATLEYIPNKGGSYDIYGVFLEDDLYSSSNSTGLAVFTVGKTDIIVGNVSGSVRGSIDLTAKLTDMGANPLPNKTIDFYVDGKYVGSNVTSENGIARYNYIISSAGNHTISAIFKGDMYADPSNGTGNGKFTQGKTNLEIAKIKGKIGDVVYLVAKLTDKNSKPLSNKKIRFYINGNYIGSAVTNKNGIARLKYIITKERFTVKTIFEGDSNYLESEDIRKFVVSKKNSTPNIIPNTNVGMKKTGIPILAILLVLCAIFVIFRKKSLRL